MLAGTTVSLDRDRCSKDSDEGTPSRRSRLSSDAILPALVYKLSDLESRLFTA